MEMIVIEKLNEIREIAQIIVKDELGFTIFLFIGLFMIMVLDMTTGFSQAKINKDIKSSKMSDGLLKKGNIILVMFAINILFILMPNYVGYPMILLAYMYCYLNELISISENLLKMGVDNRFIEIFLSKIKKYLSEYENENDDSPH